MNKYIYLCSSILKKEGFKYGNNIIGKTELLEIIKKLFKTEIDLDFLLNFPSAAFSDHRVLLDHVPVSLPEADRIL